MSPSPEFGIAIPQAFPDGRIDPDALQAFCARAEALGFGSLWTQEGILSSMPSLEPVELLTFAAAATRRARLGVAVLLTPVRSPVHLAKSLGALDHLSRGRLIAGVGIGGNTNVYPAYGISTARRAARFEEGLRLMQQLWTEPRVTFTGEFWQLANVTMEPKPVQRPHPPLWFGAHRPPAVARAARMGDGFIGAGGSSTAAFADVVATLRAALAEAGRDASRFPISKRVYLAVDEDRERARRRLVEWFGGFYRDASLAERVSVWGPPDECAARLREVVAAGAGLLILNPVFDEREQLERLANEVIPQVRGPHR
jgi:probable F420-dependent oxidoreductase